MNDALLPSFYNYLENQKRYSPNTISAYKKDLEHFFIHIKKENITAINHLIIQNYFSSLYTQNISSTTISRKLSSIKSYGKYLAKYHNIDITFLQLITLPKKRKNLPEYLHEDELNIILNMPTNTFLEIRNLLIVHLLYSTGLRLSELTNLKVNDYTKEENIFHILGKGKKERLVIFSNKSKELIELYLKHRISSSPYLLLNKNNEKLTNRGVEFILTNISKQYLGHTKLHPHMLRHTFATKLLNKGMDLRNLQELLGHDSLNATQIYTHVAKKELLELYTTYHPRSDIDRV